MKSYDLADDLIESIVVRRVDEVDLSLGDTSVSDSGGVTPTTSSAQWGEERVSPEEGS